MKVGVRSQTWIDLVIQVRIEEAVLSTVLE